MSSIPSNILLSCASPARHMTVEKAAALNCMVLRWLPKLSSVYYGFQLIPLCHTCKHPHYGVQQNEIVFLQKQMLTLSLQNYYAIQK